MNVQNTEKASFFTNFFIAFLNLKEKTFFIISNSGFAHLFVDLPTHFDIIGIWLFWRPSKAKKDKVLFKKGEHKIILAQLHNAVTDQMCLGVDN